MYVCMYVCMYVYIHALTLALFARYREEKNELFGWLLFRGEKEDVDKVIVITLYSTLHII